MNKAQQVLQIFEDSLDEVIRKEGDQYCVRSHKTNRNMGCYSSKEKAKKRLGQIQYFKHKG